MEKDYWPETPLFAIGTQGCTFHPYRRQRGVLPSERSYALLSRYQASLLSPSGKNGDKVKVHARQPKPYLESPI